MYTVSDERNEAVMKRAVGIDVGGTSLRAALVDARGEVIASVKNPLADRTPGALVAATAALVEQLAPGDATMPIGVGLAAQLRVREGRVAVAPNLGWRDVPYGSMLRERFGRPVRLVNDLDAITMGEAGVGAARGERDVVCVFLGTGLGMGAVVQGQLLEGAEGLATELGHIKVESVDDGRVCGCGQRGCLEAYTSGRHLPSLLAQKIASGLACRLADAVRTTPEAVTADRIEAAIEAGDPACAALWDDIGERMARVLGNVVAVFNPRVLVLGGGVLFAAPRLRRRIEERLSAYAPPAHASVLAVRDAALGDQAGLIGAALSALSAP